MKHVFTNDHVLPCPIEPLPEYAHATARRVLAEKLIATFHHSEAAAAAIANAVVDPWEVCKSIGDPNAPQVEEIAVPGGKVLGVRAYVWSRLIIPDPYNPRTRSTRRYAFAVDPSNGHEGS